MIIIPIIGVQPLPSRGADDHHRPGVAGTKMQVTLAKIELAMDGLVPVDRLLVLNQALANVLYDGMDPPPPGFVRVSIMPRMLAGGRARHAARDHDAGAAAS